MLRIRLRRTGRRNQPFFQIVVTEKSAPPKGGRAKEKLGFLDPVNNERSVDKERAKYWLSVGAQPSATVHNLLIEEGVIKGDKKAAHTLPEKEEEGGAEEDSSAVKDTEDKKEEEEAPEEAPEEAEASEENKKE